MRDLDKLDFHPTFEKIVDVLCKKTQNDNKEFFRINLCYYLAKIAATMRVKIGTKDRGDIPVNLYALNLQPSGNDKGHSTNLIEEKLIHKFRDNFFSSTYLQVSDMNLCRLATERAIKDDIDEELSLEKVRKEFVEAGQLMFSFDSSSGGPAIKQLRHKLLMANIGAMNMEIDEIGNNLIGNSEALGSYLELYDVGKIKQKLIKNTKENVRNEELEGRTPANLLMYGTPDKVFDGSTIEDCLYSFFDTGYGRRLFFGFSLDSKTVSDLPAEEIFDALTDPAVEGFFEEISDILGDLADIDNHNKVIDVPREVSITAIEYRVHCEKLARTMGAHEGIAKAEMSHRYFKVLKLAGAYAFLDGASVMTEDHFYYAVAMAEESGRAFKKIMHRDRPYVKLAKYIGSIGREVTHVELAEDLPFYKGSITAKHDIMQMAKAWGYKNNIVIKTSIESGIEFMTGESIQETDLENLQLAYSEQMSTGYENVQVDWKDLYTLTQEPLMHWINHHSSNGHRDGEHMITGFDMVILDVDGTATATEVTNFLADYEFLIYTTKRHTEAINRFRVVMPMNYHLKLNAVDYRAFMANIFEWLPIQVDTQTCQRCRKWLTHEGEYFYNTPKGEQKLELLDARLFIPKTAKSDERKAMVVTTQSMTNMERWFLNKAEGNRNNQLSRYGFMLADNGYGIADIKEMILAMNQKLPDKLKVSEIENTIMQGVVKRIT